MTTHLLDSTDSSNGRNWRRAVLIQQSRPNLASDPQLRNANRPSTFTTGEERRDTHRSNDARRMAEGAILSNCLHFRALPARFEKKLESPPGLAGQEVAATD